MSRYEKEEHIPEWWTLVKDWCLERPEEAGQLWPGGAKRTRRLVNETTHIVNMELMGASEMRSWRTWSAGLVCAKDRFKFFSLLHSRGIWIQLNSPRRRGLSTVWQRPVMQTEVQVDGGGCFRFSASPGRVVVSSWRSVTWRRDTRKAARDTATRWSRVKPPSVCVHTSPPI
jgi:hypothetical protein